MLFRFVLSVLLLNAPCAFSSNTVHLSELQTDIANTAQQIATEYHQSGWFSGNLLLAQHGKVFYSGSFGQQNIETNTANTLNTQFNLGSIMKDFTKVLVLQQVTAGQITLQDPLARFDLGFPKDIAKRITVEHLLNHRSGFADIFTAKYREDPLSFDSLDKKLQLLMNEPLLFEPGTESRYSNYGYVVLGAILEKISNQSFEQLLSRNIFTPLKLQNTTLAPIPGAERQSIRYGFIYDGSLQKVGITEHPGPDGGIESTVTDVQRFYRSLFYENTLLDRNNPLVRETFAMNGQHWGSYGGGAGVSAAVEVNLQEGIEIVVLANTDKLVAEFISGRIQSYLRDGHFQDIRLPEMNYAYHFYKQQGKTRFYADFQQHYADNGYTQFIGRTINELGMQLLDTASWCEAFDMFHYLVSLFPEAPQAYDSLAFAYAQQGQQQQAHNTFKKALALSPDFNSDYSGDNFLFR